MTAYEVRGRVQEIKGDPLPELRQPTEMYLSVPLRYKPVVDWALQRYGSLGNALEALKTAPPAPRQPSAKLHGDLFDGALVGAWSESQAVVREARGKWGTFLVGVNQMSGGVIAVEVGPLPRGFVLSCEVTPAGVYIATTAQGRAKMLAESIKDSLVGRKGAGHSE
jgi:hypothetical protein